MYLSHSENQSKWFASPGRHGFAKINLFCFHHAGGGASNFARWPKFLSSLVNVIPVQLPGRESRFNEPFVKSMDDVVRHLVADVSVYRDKPFAFFGHSLGSLVAFEVARALTTKHNLLPEFLAVSAHCAPEKVSGKEKLHHLSDKDFIVRLQEKYGGISEEVLGREDLLNVLLPLLKSDIWLSESYKYQKMEPLACPIVALWGSDDGNVTLDDVNSWQNESTRKLRAHEFPGGHFYIEGNEDRIFPVINKLIARSLNMF